MMKQVLALIVGTSLTYAAFDLGTSIVHADTPAMLDAGPSAAAPAAPSLTEEFKDLQAKYTELKSTSDKSARMLLWAALIAAGLKLLIDGLKLISPWLGTKKTWIPWIATAAAVPIALLSHYAGGAGWFASLIYAGAGPGAVVITELLALFAKAKQPLKAV